MTVDKSEEPLTDTKPVPEDIFGILGNRIRIDILWTLHEAFVQGPPDTLSFSELNSRISIDTNSSQLNYHLQQLVGDFVRKIDGLYELSAAGRHLCESLRKGIFDQPKRRMSVDAGFNCHYCNRGVKATFNYCQLPVDSTFNEGYVYIQCPGCEYIYIGNIMELPFEAFRKEEAFTQFKKYTHHKILAFVRGICMVCGNAVGADFHTPDEIPLPIFQPRNKVGIDRSCNYCGSRMFLPVGIALLNNVGLITFCYEHGVDVLSTPSWELEFAGTDKHITVLSTDPWKVGLEVTFNGDTLELVVDGDLNVIAQNTR